MAAFDHPLHAFRGFQIGDGKENRNSNVEVERYSLPKSFSVESNKAYCTLGASGSKRSKRPRTSPVGKKGVFISPRILMTNRKPRKKAVVIGMVYPKRNKHLFHSQREIEAVQQLLTSYYAFLDRDIVVLCDRGPYPLPKKEKIEFEIKKMINGSSAGDVLYLHFSCHGSNGKRLGLSPHIITTDGFRITDLFWDHMMDLVPYGVTLFVLMNCCNAGAMMKKAKERRHKGEIIVLTLTGEDTIIYDGYFLKNILTTE